MEEVEWTSGMEFNGGRGAELITHNKTKEEKWSKSNSTNQFLLWFVSWLLSFPLFTKRKREKHSNSINWIGGALHSFSQQQATPSTTSLFSLRKKKSLLLIGLLLSSFHSAFVWLNSINLLFCFVRFLLAEPGAAPPAITHQKKESKKQINSIHQTAPLQ